MSVCGCIPVTVPTAMAGSIRLYVAAALAEGETLAVSAAQTHYLANVMRRGPGDTLLLFNGRDGEFAAQIEDVRRGQASLRIGQRRRPQAPGPDIWLLFALLKRDATDLVVQKATELGAAALHPVITERSNTHRMNAGRLRAIAIEAAEQCERLDVPVLHQPRPLVALLSDWPPGRRLFAAIERGEAPGLQTVDGRRALLVGPEGGFTPAELEALRAHPFVAPVSLGPFILRADTACIAGLAMLRGVDCH
jgi:16S rRNA (uracil1498-N3)-methyltransferase